MRAIEWVWLLGWPFAFGWAVASSQLWRKRYLRLQKTHADERATLRQVHVLIHKEVAVRESWAGAVPPKDFRN